MSDAAQTRTRPTTAGDGPWVVAELLGGLGADLTGVVDRRLGSDWAENDEILALLALRHGEPRTTRDLAGTSGMNRRTLSRMTARLRDADIVRVAPSAADRRAVALSLTDHGRACFAALERDVATLLERHRDTAAEICDRLERAPGAVDEGPGSAGPLGPLGPLDLLEVIVGAGADLVRSIAPPAGPGQLSGSQRTALVRIAAGGLVRPVDLGPALGIGRSGVAYVIDRLCAKGLVARRRDEVAGDRRAVLLEATDAGRQGASAVEAAVEVHGPRLLSVFAAVRDRPSAGRPR